MSPLPTAPSRRRAALLLEVVVALAILVTAMGLLGAQLSAGLTMVERGEENLRAALLADRMIHLARLDPELRQRVLEEEIVEEEFGDYYPGWFYRITLEPIDQETEEEQFGIVVVEILYQHDPDDWETIDGADVMRRMAFLRAAPPKIDLVEEAGLSQDMIDQLEQLVPIAGFDPHNVDLQQLVALLDEGTLEQLMPMLTPILAQLGINLSGQDLQGLLNQAGGANVQELLQGAGAGQVPGSQEDMEQLIRDLAGGAGGGGRGARDGAGRGRGRGDDRGPGGRGGRSPGRTEPPPIDENREVDGIEIGPGSGPGGEYTIEDLMRLREQYERQQGGR